MTDWFFAITIMMGVVALMWFWLERYCTNHRWWPIWVLALMALVMPPMAISLMLVMDVNPNTVSTIFTGNLHG